MAAEGGVIGLYAIHLIVFSFRSYAAKAGGGYDGAPVHGVAVVGGDPELAVGGEEAEKVLYREVDGAAGLEGGKVNYGDCVLVFCLISAAVGYVQLVSKNGEAFRLEADFQLVHLICGRIYPVYFSVDAINGAVHGCAV